MKIYIGKSKLHGKGLLASRDIKRGETVFTIKGKKVKFLIDSEKQAKIAGLNWVGVGKNEWIDPINHCVFFNHSCNPNSAIKGRYGDVIHSKKFRMQKNELLGKILAYNIERIICLRAVTFYSPLVTNTFLNLFYQYKMRKR